jgi:hypothetical protein
VPFQGFVGAVCEGLEGLCLVEVKPPGDDEGVRRIPKVVTSEVPRRVGSDLLVLPAEAGDADDERPGGSRSPC